MWQVGVVFAALASFCGAAGDALVRLSFVLEAKRRRKQRQLLLLRQLHRSSSSRARRTPNSTGRWNNSSSSTTASGTRSVISCSDGPCGVDGSCDNGSSECQTGRNKTEDRAGAEGSSRTAGSRECGKGGGRRRTEWNVSGRVDGEAAGEKKEAEVLRLTEEGEEEQEGDLASREELQEQEEAQIFVPARPFYLRPLWLLGTCLGTVINTLLSIISLDFASAAVVTPFAGLHIFWNVIFSRFILQERVLTQHYVGSAMVLFGLFFVLCYGVHTPPTLSLEQLLRLYSQKSCVIYFCLSALALLPCVYIGIFGKDASQQQRQEQQQKLRLSQPREHYERQQQQLTARQGRSKMLAYHVVGDGEELCDNTEEEERGTCKSSNSSVGDHGNANGAAAAPEMEDVLSCRGRRSSSVTVCRREVRSTFRLMEGDEEELGGMSGRLCEALPEAGRSFSSFSCEDDDSLRSGSESDTYSPRDLRSLSNTSAYSPRAATAAEADFVGALARTSADSAAAVAVRDLRAAAAAESPAAAGAAADEGSSQWSSRPVPLPNEANAAAAGVVGCSGCCAAGNQPPAEAAITPPGKPPAWTREREKRVRQHADNSRRPATATAARGQQQQQREGSKGSNGSRRCMRHGSSTCLTIDAFSAAQEKTWASETSVSSDASPAWKDVESGRTTAGRCRGRGHHHQQAQLQTQQQTRGAWRVPAALQVEVPVALRRFCIAAASGGCGGNTNIIMEHVMDVWHTESLASLFHPKFFLLLLLLCLMACGQLVFLNLGLARYEALYVVPTTMSVLIISSCLGEISVFIHVLELSQTEFLIFAGGALSIVSGIMVLSAADMERQQETSTAERVKEEDEQLALETEFSERLRSRREELSHVDAAETDKQGVVLAVHVPGDPRPAQGRCITTSTECTCTNVSNPDVTEAAAAAATTDSNEAGAAVVEQVKMAGREGSELRGTFQEEGRPKAALQKKKGRRRNKPEERGQIKTPWRKSRSVDRVTATVEGTASDAGIELGASAHSSASYSQKPAGAVATVEPSAPRAAVAAASPFLTVTRHPRSPTAGFLAAAAAVPQALFCLVRGSSRGVTRGDIKQHSSGRNSLRSRYQRLRRGTYSCAAVQSGDEETCEVHSSSRPDGKTSPYLLNDSESGGCTCQPHDATPQSIVEEFDKTDCSRLS